MDSAIMNNFLSQLWQDQALFILALDVNGRVTYANAKAQQRFGDSKGILVGANWFDLTVLPEDRPMVQARFLAMMKGEMENLMQISDVDVVAADGARLRILWSNHLLRDSGGVVTGLLSFGQDITEQRRTQFRLELQQATARIVDESETFSAAVEKFLRLACEQFDWDFGEVWLYEKSRQAMVWQSCFEHGTGDYRRFCELSQNSAYAMGHGVPGIVWQSGNPLWIENVVDNPTFLRREEAKRIGLHCAFGFPVRVGDTVAGVINFLSRRIQPPDEGLIKLFDSIGVQLGNYYQRKTMEAQMQIWTELFRNSGEPIMVLDTATRILAVNEAFTRLTGYPAAEIVGENPGRLWVEQRQAFASPEFWADLNQTGSWQGELRCRQKDGTEYLRGISAARIRDAQGLPAHYIVTFTDDRERKAAEERIRYLVYHDTLTGLPNRALLFERINMAVAQAGRSKKLVVLFSIDIDRFKVINDSLGHQIGDELLRQVAQGLRQCLREEDTLSRPGGDEFVILFPNIGELNAVVPIAEKVARTVRQPIRVNGREFNLTASIGISVYPNDGADRDALLKNADAAMNFAKETGRNQYHFFTKDLSRIVTERLKTEINLRQALERQEFLLHYQPQIDIRTRRVAGLEALIRWNQPDEGLIPPGKFIPLAEESGLILPVGDWILGEAAQQWRQWSQAGLPPVTMAVNISAIQFYQHDFLEKISRLVKECGLESYLEIEVTEGVMMKDIAVTLDIMHKLKAIGCKLSIDDFGTGYSSLGYISRFPLDKLKIDQSFVRAMLTSQTNMAIVDTIIRLANNLHLRVIAEGVETAEEMAALAARRCDEVQGYYFAKPMPAEELSRWWSDWNRAVRA